MKGRSRWIALVIVVAALVAGILLFGPRWATRQPPTGAAAPVPRPDLSPAATSTAPDTNTSEMLKMARAAFLACGAPVAPTDLPDGKTATRDQMVEAHETVKAFDEATNIYNQCLDTTSYQAAVQFKSVATPVDAQALTALQVRLHNEAIDRDQNLANRFNVQLRLFKVRGKP